MHTLLDVFPKANIEDRCPSGYFSNVYEFAEKTNQIDSLKKAIDSVAKETYFGRPAKTVIYKDFAPNSFGFSILAKSNNGEWQHQMEGGIIYHGKHDNGGDGGGPTYSVNLTPQNGWSVHT